MVWKARVPKWHQQTDTDVLGLGNLAFQDLALTGFQFKLLNISCSPCRSQEEGCGIHGGGSQGPSLPCLSGPRFDRWLWVEINKKTYGEEGLSLWGQEGAMKREFASWVWLGKRVRSLNLQMGKWDPVLPRPVFEQVIFEPVGISTYLVTRSTAHFPYQGPVQSGPCSHLISCHSPPPPHFFHSSPSGLILGTHQGQS